MNKTAKTFSIVILTLVVISVIAWWPVKSYLINRYGEMGLEGAQDLLMIRLGLKEEYVEPILAVEETDDPQAEIEIDGNIVPFRQIGDTLGERGLDRNFGIMRGGTVFDANGDGRLDLYLPYAQRTFAKQTEPNGLLTDKDMPAWPSVLFLNQGNDDKGDPVFVSVQDLLAKGNKQLEKEELLIEGKYQPRNSVGDDEVGMGRIGWGAVSADFNGDGRVDLYVLNGHFGVMIQTKEVGFQVYPAPKSLGREARREPIVMQMYPFIRHEMVDGLTETVDYGAGTERDGRNTLYLNMGDQDGDGIPEWQDATVEAGVGGNWATSAAAVADYDRDGDLDLYVVNFYDPDHWGFGMERFAGHRNQLYKNLLQESGELKFKDVAGELKVAGYHPDEDLATSVYFPIYGEEQPISKQYVGGVQVGEEADHSWAAGFFDWNDDGWVDLVVANDIGNRLRVYENEQGKGFRYLKEFDEHSWEGCWMGTSFGDLDGDLKDEILLTNCGSQAASIRNTALLVEDNKETSLTAINSINYLAGRNTLHHEMIQFRDGGFQRMAAQTKINHSPYIAPDQTNPANFAPAGLERFEEHNYADSLAGLEFAWHVPILDVDNDGDLDLYFAGALTRGNDDAVGDWSGNPGRMLVNESTQGNFEFSDRTLEYRLLDIEHMDYDHNPPRRPSPSTGWHKRDYIYVTDMDSYSGMGLDASQAKTHDIFRMHEAAFGIMDGDLNGDGNVDLVVAHVPGFGYNSISPINAKNLKIEVAGKVLAVPAPNKIGKAPTNYQPASTFVYINGGPPKNQTGNWVKVRLQDKSGHNLYGIGAKLTINGNILRRVNIGGKVASSSHGDLHVGLGGDSLQELEIAWPSGEMETQRLQFDPPVAGETICVDREKGRVECG